MLACCACKGGKSVASASSQGDLHIWHADYKIVVQLQAGLHLPHEVAHSISGHSDACVQAGSMLACCACEGGSVTNLHADRLCV